MIQNGDIKSIRGEIRQINGTPMFKINVLSGDMNEQQSTTTDNKNAADS